MLKKYQRTVLAGAAMFLALSLSGTAMAEETQVIYKFYCAQCHGLEGKGDGPNVTKDMPVTPRNFTNAEDMNKLSDSDLRTAILDGGPAVSKSPIMPPWSKTLTGEDADGLVKMLRQMCNCKGKQG